MLFRSEFGPASQADESKSKLRNVYFSGEKKFNSLTQVQFDVGHYTDRLDASVTLSPYAVYNAKDQFRIGMTHKLADRQTLTLGYENGLQRIQSPDTTYTATSRKVEALRAGYQYLDEKQSLQVNVRNDSYERFNDALTYYLGYQYFLSEKFRLIASQSTGFMVPTFNDLYYPASWGGNPNLRPEHSRSNEAGFQWVDGVQTLRAVVFRNRYKDLIENDSYYNRVNVGSAVNLGHELSYKREISNGSFRVTYVGQNPRNLDDNSVLVRRARNFISTGLTQNWHGWQTETSLRHVGSRKDQASAVTYPLGSYTLIDFSVSRPINQTTTWFGRIDNLTDRDYSSVYGYHSLRRALSTGIRVNL